jgi:hypothetical protein
MSRRREREIARRLAERGDLDPPADLLGRIHAEIPEAVKVGPDVSAPGREASRPPARQRWLLAASLVAMVGAGLLSLRLYEGDRGLGAPSSLATAPPASVAPSPEVPRPAPMRVFPRESPAADAAPPVLRKLRRAPEAAAPSAEAEAPGAPGGVVGGVVGGAPGKAESSRVEQKAPPPPAETNAPQPVQPLAAESPALADAPAPAASETTAMAAPSSGLAEGGAPAAPRAKATMANAERARASQTARGFVDAAAAPRDAFRPRSDSGADTREGRAENLIDAVTIGTPSPVAEGAPSPFAAGERQRLVLFRLSGAAHSGPEVEVTFDPAAVARYRRVSAGPVVLYEVELQPGAPAGAAVATLRGGARLRVADLAPAWEQASSGFRLASLSAELAAIAEGARPRSDLPELLRRARTLAAEIPGDPQAAALVRRIERLSP